MIKDGFMEFETPEEYIDFEKMCFVGSIRDDGFAWYDGSEESIKRKFITYLGADSDSIEPVTFTAALNAAMPEIVREAMVAIENFEE